VLCVIVFHLFTQVRADDEDKRRRIRLVRPGAQPPQKKAKKTTAAKKTAAAKKPAKKKAKSDAAPEEDEEAPAAPAAPAPANGSVAAGLATALKVSLEYPDNWRPLESMSYEEVEVPQGSQEWASLSVLMNGTIAPFHKV
jgi:predicted lipid-binding transport protein (Tim44 family)